MFPTVNGSDLSFATWFSSCPKRCSVAAIVVMLLIRLGPGRIHLGGLSAAVTFVGTARRRSGLWFEMRRRERRRLHRHARLRQADAVRDGSSSSGAAATDDRAHASSPASPIREDSGDFHVLLLGGTLGMLLMAVGQPPADGVSSPSRWRACPATPWPASSRASGKAARRRSNTSSMAAALRASCSTASACWPAGSAPATCPTWRRATWPHCRRRPAAGRRDPLLGHAVHPGRPGLQAVGRAVPLLVPGRVRGGGGRGGGVPVGRVQGRRRSCSPAG